MANDSDLEKSEQPTDSKLKKAKEEGQIPRSRELTSVIILLVGLASLYFFGSQMSASLTMMMQQGMVVSQFGNDEKLMLINFMHSLQTGFWLIVPILCALVIVALFAPMCIGGLLFSSKSMQFDLKRLNPVSGFKRIFSSKIIAELLKGLLKVLLITLMTGGFLWATLPTILSLPNTFFVHALSQSMNLILFCGVLVVVSLAPMVGFDIFYQFWSHLKKLKMTKQEIKDEFKEQEGDPQLKGRIRQMQQSIARRRMMGDVNKANVIITNPTHYAVALQYDEKTMHAPKVLAKGVDKIALKIKQLASEHQIPQLEAPPLARALYRHSEVGETIPAELYAAVAQVLAWVYQLKRWHQRGGTAPVKPQHLPVPTSLDPAVKKGHRQSHE
ncbi:flagellar type III secretion system protein FlhB [Frischella sp. Ac13]|uniref:Flagellar biosynthetic protein FlhB n=1 Tax=Frischella japonica TaxID=2741544 RepID=A0ABR7R0K5_9GAMM|nr:flagellar biosynthesis protein FlhB [Frischella japonica]MBC9131982.1 flagellar type III secretion system protein FlhB [Frischella japonica]